jgi:hypothetical protein
MLNDKLIVRQSQHLAERVARSADDVTEQIRNAFRLILGRAPTPHESQAVTEYARGYGLANACRVLLNSNEFMFVD